MSVITDEPEICSVCRHDGPMELRYIHRVCMAVIKQDETCSHISKVYCGCLCDEERAKRPTIEVAVMQ